MEMTQVLSLALKLMRQHGFEHLDLTVSNTKRALGRCFYKYDHGKRQYVAERIDLSRVWMTKVPEAKVRDTILHELAHAMTPGAKHGPAWRAAARKLGANPSRIADLPSDMVLEIRQEVANYKAVCKNPHCDTVHYFHRMTKHWKLGNYRCAKCRGEFKVSHN